MRTRYSIQMQASDKRLTKWEKVADGEAEKTHRVA